MTVKDLKKALNKIIKENPEAKDYEVLVREKGGNMRGISAERFVTQY